MAVTLPRRLLPITRTLLWRPAQESYVLPGGVPGDDAEPYVLFVSQRTLLEVETAVRSSAGVTAFGILTGQRFHCPNTDTKYMVLNSALWAPGLVVYQNAVPPEMLAAAVQNLRPARGQEILGWYRSGMGVGPHLAAVDRDLHLRFFREPWQVMLLSAPHIEPPAGGFFAIDRASMHTGLVPFHELLHAKALSGRDVKYTCVTWHNYVTDEAVEALPDGEREEVRGSSDTEATEGASRPRQSPERVAPIAEPPRSAMPRPATPWPATPRAAEPRPAEPLRTYQSPPDRAAAAARPTPVVGAQPVVETGVKAAAEPVVMPPSGAPPRPATPPPSARSAEPADPLLEGSTPRFVEAAGGRPPSVVPEPLYGAAVDKAAVSSTPQRAANPATPRTWQTGSADAGTRRPANSGLFGPSSYTEADQVLLRSRRRRRRRASRQAVRLALACLGGLSLIAAAVLALRKYRVAEADRASPIQAEGSTATSADRGGLTPAPPSNSLLTLFDQRKAALEHAIAVYQKAEPRFAQRQIGCGELSRAYQAVDERFVELSMALVPSDAQRTARYAELVGETNRVETSFDRSRCPRP